MISILLQELDFQLLLSNDVAQALNVCTSEIDFMFLDLLAFEMEWATRNRALHILLLAFEL